MGLMDWLSGGFSAKTQQDDIRGMRATVDVQFRAFQERAKAGSLQMTRCYAIDTPMTWTIAKGYHPAPPKRLVDTHKTRMARLIARRDGKAR